MAESPKKSATPAARAPRKQKPLTAATTADAVRKIVTRYVMSIGIDHEQAQNIIINMKMLLGSLTE